MEGEQEMTERYLVFGGGGTHGVTYLGALSALERARGMDCSLWDLAGVAGTSAGSVAALMVLLGLSHDTRHRLTRALSDMTSVVPCPDLHLFYRSFGWDGGARFRALLQEALQEGGLSPEATLADVRRLVRREFACVCTDLVACAPVVLSATTYPKMRVVDAVYASCCVPFLFVPLQVDGRVFVDGCLTRNVPTDLFPPEETLVVCLDPHAVHVPENLAQYANAVVRCSTIAQYRAIDASVRRLAIVSTGDPTFHRSMSDAVFASMYADGYACALDFARGGGLIRAVGACAVVHARLTWHESTTSPPEGFQSCD